MNKNAQGTRGLSRFSHWYHGTSGIERANQLLETVNNPESNYDDIVEKMADCVSSSSNTKHSLRQYLNTAFGGERELNKILQNKPKHSEKFLK